VDEMKTTLKRMLGWDQKTEAAKAPFRRLTNNALGLGSHFISLFPIPLWFLLSQSNSDKHQVNGHLYGYTYEQLFRPFKYKFIKLLEIGVDKGESLKAWQFYFPFAKIIGCDIRDMRSIATRRLKIYQLDQSSEGQLQAICKAETVFDIIIDDGSHLSTHQIFTFEHLYPALKDRGIYIIEDVQTSYWSEWEGAPISDPAFEKTCVGYFLNLTKYINHSEFIDRSDIEMRMMELAKSIKQIIFEHNLIIIMKGDNSQPSNWRLPPSPPSL